MNDKLGLSLAFIAGVAAGAFVAWKALENKYKQMADEEVESVKEMFNRKLKEQNEEQINMLKGLGYEETSVEKQNEEYDNMLKGLGYKKSGKEGKEDMARNAKVYVIPPESFGEIGYDTVSLTYYADKVLVDCVTNEVIANVDEIVGRGSLETFGEYEDDSVFVRNDELEKDYEILLDMRNYSDVVTRKPHLVTDDNE